MKGVTVVCSQVKKEGMPSGTAGVPPAVVG
jgi:hypothetical protein